MLKFIIIILSLFTLTFCDNISAKNDIEIYQSENIVIESTSKVSDELRELCEEAGGYAKVFSNGCVNSCSLFESKTELICTQALKAACMCKENYCFDNKISKCRLIRK